MKSWEYYFFLIVGTYGFLSPSVCLSYKSEVQFIYIWAVFYHWNNDDSFYWNRVSSNIDPHILYLLCLIALIEQGVLVFILVYIVQENIHSFKLTH